MNKNLTALEAQKSSSIRIKDNQIIVCFKKRSKLYGTYEVCKSYTNNAKNFVIASRYQ